jgi:hypothetical protein
MSAGSSLRRVAPRWDDDPFSRVAWPTAGLPYPAAKFTTEEFIRAIVADVQAKAKINPRRVIRLGWSSGGPPCYAPALRRDSAITGAFRQIGLAGPPSSLLSDGRGSAEWQGNGRLPLRLLSRVTRRSLIMVVSSRARYRRWLFLCVDP